MSHSPDNTINNLYNLQYDIDTKLNLDVNGAVTLELGDMIDDNKTHPYLKNVECIINTYPDLEPIRKSINNNDTTIVVAPDRTFNITSLVANGLSTLGVVHISQYYDMFDPSTSRSGNVSGMYNTCILNRRNHCGYSITRNICSMFYDMVHKETPTINEDKYFDELLEVTNCNVSVDDICFVGCKSHSLCFNTIESYIMETAFNIDNDSKCRNIESIVEKMSNYDEIVITLSLTTDLSDERLFELLIRLKESCNVRMIEITDYNDNDMYLIKNIIDVFE
jgi:arginase family enzyme